MSRQTLDDTLAFIAKVDKSQTPAQIADVVVDAARPFGFSYVLQRYFSQGYLFDEPSVHRVNTFHHKK